jgi:hypothetical protein
MGLALGKIFALMRPDELPSVPMAPNESQVAAILREWDVTRVMFVTVDSGGYVFAALERGGEWFDMQRKQLQIVNVRGE